MLNTLNSNKVRILYIGNKLEKHGNNVTSIDSLGKLLEAEGHRLTYASSAKNKMVRLLDMIVTTIKSARKTDVVLIDTYSTANFYYALIISQLCRIFNLKYIPLLHGGDLPNRLKNTPKLSRLLFKNAWINVSPSRYLQTEFESAGFHKIKYIPNSIEIQNYKFKSRNTQNCRLLWVRSLAEIYNPKMAINVLHQLKTEFPHATLCMIGPDKENLLPSLKNLAAELGVEVTFTGVLPKSDWIKRSEQSDIFINTTHYDNLPVSVIEAMALGLPVVSTNVGGLKVLLRNRENALVVDDNDHLAMANAISELAKNQNLATELSQRGRLDAEQFDWVNIKSKWAEILN